MMKEKTCYTSVESSHPLRDALQESLSLPYSAIDEMTAQPEGLFINSIEPIVYYTRDGKRTQISIDNNIKISYGETYVTQVEYWNEILKD